MTCPRPPLFPARMDWTAETDFHRLAPDHRAELQRLPVRQLPAGQPLFHPGDRAEGFLILLQGRVEVFLTGPSGREILLYAVEPGETCVQTTLGLLGPGTYSGAAVTATDCRAVMVPARLSCG
ncbi:Crp/Fnr family transcriptional regulator [Gemmobacter lanyuensis]